MSDPEIGAQLRRLERALARLGETLELDLSEEVYRDALIQRFECTFELCWKTLRRLLRTLEVEVALPKLAFQAAFEAGWIQDEQPWSQMLRDRNVSSHVYDEATARDISMRIPAHCLLRTRFLDDLKKRFLAEYQAAEGQE